MATITCPRCSIQFSPVPGLEKAFCPACGNVSAAASTQFSETPEEAGSLDFTSTTASRAATRRYGQKTRKPGTGMAVASLSLGVVAICLTLLGCALPFVFLVAIPCAILAVVFGYVGLDTEGHNMAVAGLVTGWATIAIDVVAVIVTAAFIGSLFHSAFRRSEVPIDRERLRLEVELDDLELRERIEQGSAPKPFDVDAANRKVIEAQRKTMGRGKK